jgi:hypothetical protein
VSTVRETALRATMARLRLRQADAVREAGVSKRGILALCQGESRARETTEAKLLAWLRKYDRRVTLRDIVGPLVVVLALLGAGCGTPESGSDPIQRVVTSDGSYCVEAREYRWDDGGGGCVTFWHSVVASMGYRKVATYCGVSRIVEDPTCTSAVAKEGGGK